AKEYRPRLVARPAAWQHVPGSPRRRLSGGAAGKGNHSPRPMWGPSALPMTGPSRPSTWVRLVRLTSDYKSAAHLIRGSSYRPWDLLSLNGKNDASSLTHRNPPHVS